MAFRGDRAAAARAGRGATGAASAGGAAGGGGAQGAGAAHGGGAESGRAEAGGTRRGIERCLTPLIYLPRRLKCPTLNPSTISTAKYTAAATPMMANRAPARSQAWACIAGQSTSDWAYQQTAPIAATATTSLTRNSSQPGWAS